MTVKVNKIGVVGAGQMGRGIAQVAAMSGYSVVLYDINDQGLKQGLEFIHQQLSRGVERGKWDDVLVEQVSASLATANTLTQLSDCDLVIEAATENKSIKCDLFSQLAEVCSDNAVLASNTSSISITEIAAATTSPEKVVGMHFMNPVPVMKLVEGIRGLETSDDTFAVVESVADAMGKTLIEVNDVAGFAINRILMPMINEAIYTHYEGIASIEDIDLGMKLGTAQPMGPFELADFIGLDTCMSIMDVLYEGLGDTKYRKCPLLKNYVMAGRLGRKSGRGFYQY